MWSPREVPACICIPVTKFHDNRVSLGVSTQPNFAVRGAVRHCRVYSTMVEYLIANKSNDLPPSGSTLMPFQTAYQDGWSTPRLT